MRKLIFFSLLFISGYMVAQEWQQVPLVSQTIKNNGHFGGEGAQWLQAIEVDAQDGSFLLLGTDVGGIFRSTNGGDLWEPCNIGYNARGNCGFAIDPNNNQRALAIGGNSTNNFSHGIYLTTDQGNSWSHVLQEDNYKGYRDFKDKVAFDKTSLSDGISTIAYWSNPAGGLYKSTDGGSTWSQVNSGYGASVLKISPNNGTVYIGNASGFHRSTNGGTVFSNTLAVDVKDITISNSQPSKVWVTTANAIYVSDDNGANFSQISSSGYPGNVITLNVSPSNASKMVVCHQAGSFSYMIYYSTNGGSNWSQGSMNSSNAFLPFNGRQQEFAWHPTNDSKIWAFGGDWITSSSNTGANFSWDANGYTGLAHGDGFNFNVTENILYLGIKDYDAAYTNNDGYTWTYFNSNGLSYGGTTWAGYAASSNVFVSFDRNDNQKIIISKNGGSNFTKTNVAVTGQRISYSCPNDANIVFVSDYRSTNLGTSWSKMSGCTGVYTHDPSNNTLYGSNGTSVVKSTDKGSSWQTVTTLPSGNNVFDVSIDHSRNKLYIGSANNRKLFVYENGSLTDITSQLPANQFGVKAAKSVSVDPVNPDVVYVACNQNTYASDASAMRSTDGGQSWEVLTRRTNNPQFGKDGAREANFVRVNPYTREAWFATSCYGIWKIAKPDSIEVIPVESVTVLPQDVNLDKDEKQQITATVLPLDATYTSVSWSSNNTSVAEVDDNGMVTAMAAGNATITATAKGNVKGQTNVTVNGLSNVDTWTTENGNIFFYPNPVIGNSIKIDITNSKYHEVSIEVADINGRTVSKGVFSTGVNIIPMSFSPGIYLLKVQAGDQVSTRKVVKQ